MKKLIDDCMKRPQRPSQIIMSQEMYEECLRQFGDHCLSCMHPISEHDGDKCLFGPGKLERVVG